MKHIKYHSLTARLADEPELYHYMQANELILATQTELKQYCITGKLLKGKRFKQFNLN
jgi:hypothetical protein